MWEFVLNEPKYDSYATQVTAKCSECGEPMFDNPAVIGWNNRENGTIIWSGFITNYKDYPESAKQFAFESAEYSRYQLPKYCAKCGKQMNT